MRTTGTSHLVAVSGQNVTLLAGVFIAGMACLIGRRQAAWLAVAVIIAYAALVGGHPPVIRAAIMAIVFVLSIVVGRQNTAAIALLIAGALMTAHDPQIIHDVGFQLSFAATIGIVSMGNDLRERIEGAAHRFPVVSESPAMKPVAETFSMTFAAIIFTLPVTAISFGEVSLIALPANLLAVPAFIAVAFAAVLALVASLFPGGLLTSWVAWIPATYMIGVIEFMASFPVATVSVSGLGLWFAALWYLPLLASTLVGMSHRVDHPTPRPPLTASVHPLVPPAGAAIVIVAATVFVWVSLITSDRDPRLTVTFLDVGQGDAALIEGPSGNRILVDGGPSGALISEALGRTMPFYDRRLDLMVLTHPQTDHGAGLIEMMEVFEVGAVLDSAVTNEESAFGAAWQQALDSAGLPVHAARRGMRAELGSGARVDVLAPRSSGLTPWADPNDASTVLRITMGQVSILLTGDIEAEGEAMLIRSGEELRATVLKVAHHGSRTSSTPQFISRVAPRVAVVSVGEDNRFGHPAAEVLARFEEATVLRTDRDGDVRIETDGERVWVTTQR